MLFRSRLAAAGGFGSEANGGAAESNDSNVSSLDFPWGNDAGTFAALPGNDDGGRETEGGGGEAGLGSDGLGSDLAVGVGTAVRCAGAGLMGAANAVRVDGLTGTNSTPSERNFSKCWRVASKRSR